MGAEASFVCAAVAITGGGDDGEKDGMGRVGFPEVEKTMSCSA
jgi:hypothetical protein